MSTGISDDNLVVGYACFCPPEVRGPFEVTVENGEVIRIRFDGAVIEPQPGITPVAAAKALLTVGSMGNVSTKTLTTFNEDEYRDITAGLP